VRSLRCGTGGTGARLGTRSAHHSGARPRDLDDASRVGAADVTVSSSAASWDDYRSAASTPAVPAPEPAPTAPPTPAPAPAPARRPPAAPADSPRRLQSLEGRLDRPDHRVPLVAGLLQRSLDLYPEGHPERLQEVELRLQLRQVRRQRLAPPLERRLGR